MIGERGFRRIDKPFCDPPGESVRNLHPDNQKIISSNFCISNI